MNSNDKIIKQNKKQNQKKKHKAFRLAVFNAVPYIVVLILYASFFLHNSITSDSLAISIGVAFFSFSETISFELSEMLDLFLKKKPKYLSLFVDKPCIPLFFSIFLFLFLYIVINVFCDFTDSSCPFLANLPDIVSNISLIFYFMSYFIRMAVQLYRKIILNDVTK